MKLDKTEIFCCVSLKCEFMCQLRRVHGIELTADKVSDYEWLNGKKTSIDYAKFESQLKVKKQRIIKIAQKRQFQS